jgi:glycosyltransferase involved in cell wall biosynthesis
MASSKIEIVAAPPVDPTSGSFRRTVWGLADALAERGHRVRVLYPAPPTSGPAAGNGAAVPVAVPVVARARRPTGRVLDVARELSASLESDADLVIATDAKAGALSPPHAHGRHRAPASFSLLLPEEGLPPSSDADDGSGRAGGFRGRIGEWIDRRARTRLETAALKRARLVWTISSEGRDRIAERHRLPADRIRVLPPAAPEPSAGDTRDEARRALRLPLDVPVVLFVGHSPDAQGLPLAIESFRRVRVFFPGARFAVLGCTAPSEPGVVSFGVVDEATKARAFAAGDVFLYPARESTLPLAALEAMRYGVAAIVGPKVRFPPPGPGAGARVVASDVPGDYASDLAEMLADPALRRRIATAGRRYAEEFTFARMAEAFEREALPNAAA